jgi:hypothetical protein
MDKNFEIGDLVLKWDKLKEPKGKHSQFQQLWLGTFQVAKTTWPWYLYIIKHGGRVKNYPWPNFEETLLLASARQLAYR